MSFAKSPALAPTELSDALQAALINVCENAYFLFVEPCDGPQFDEAGFALGQRARFIHDHGRYFFEPLDGFGIFHEHAGLRAASDADHDRHGRGEAERARARDDEHADGGDQAECEAWLRSPD